MAKHFEIITLPDGRQARDYGDGIPRNERGQIITPQKDAPVITRENAHEYHRMRKQKILDAIERNVMDVTKTKAPADAIGAIVAKRAKVAMTDDSKTGNDAAKIVLSAIDAYQDKAQQGQQTTIRNEYALDDDTKQLLYAMIQERRDSGQDVDVIDVGTVGSGGEDE